MSNVKMISIMQTIMERMEERLSSVEATLQQLGPVQVLQERLSQLEHNIYSTKNMLTFDEACRYLGVSESLLYKLTSTKDVPHFKPRGKMLYFSKAELDAWLSQNPVKTLKQASQEAADEAQMTPYFNRKRYGKRTK